MRRRGAKVMEVKSETQMSFVEELRARLAGTVWQAGGCRSWYQDARTGESPVLWPGSVVSYMRKTKAAAESDYLLSAGAPKTQTADQRA
jgi:hypothetical protein